MKKNWHRNKFNLCGRIAVVTGGCGILGKYFCDGLADHGANVAVIDLDQNEVDNAAIELCDNFGINAIGVACDISNTNAVMQAAEKIEQELGPIDILHNNAATKGKSLESFLEPLESYSLETWREIMSVNLDGMFLVAKEIGGRMAARGQGSIIQTASVYGVLGSDNRIYEGSEYNGMPINNPAVYSASKAGVVGLTQHLATYWAAKGVRVNTLTPGGVESGQNDAFKQRYSSRVPLGRMGHPEEMVGALIFLASDASSYITGQNILVDGGLSAW